MTDPWFGDAARAALRAAGRDAVATTLEDTVVSAGRWRHGHLADWLAAIDALPRADGRATTDGDAVRIESDADRAAIETVARRLIPWRKGPFDLGGVVIDSEWRCEQKWARLEAALPALDNRHVLDVGCGNGYFALRLAAAGAASVVGIDPTVAYVAQFRLIERLGHGLPAAVLPLALEDLDDWQMVFDLVLSAGVLYHRRSPLDHLRALFARTAPGGWLALETLVVPGDASTALVPPDRYASMRNVWFLPSVEATVRWLERTGFASVTVQDVTTTTAREQRATEWMPFQSLADALDPADPDRTIEGHPAPTRALLTARRPT